MKTIIKAHEWEKAHHEWKGILDFGDQSFWMNDYQAEYLSAEAGGNYICIYISAYIRCKYIIVSSNHHVEPKL